MKCVARQARRKQPSTPGQQVWQSPDSGDIGITSAWCLVTRHGTRWPCWPKLILLSYNVKQSLPSPVLPKRHNTVATGPIEGRHRRTFLPTRATMSDRTTPEIRGAQTLRDAALYSNQITSNKLSNKSNK